MRFDKNKLTQVVISNKNTSILYNDLKLFSKDVLGELIKNEKYIERTMGYVFVDLGLAITHDIKTIYFSIGLYYLFGRIKIDLLLVGEAEEGNN